MGAPKAVERSLQRELVRLGIRVQRDAGADAGHSSEAEGDGHQVGNARRSLVRYLWRLESARGYFSRRLHQEDDGRLSQGRHAGATLVATARCGRWRGTLGITQVRCVEGGSRTSRLADSRQEREARPHHAWYGSALSGGEGSAGVS